MNRTILIVICDFLLISILAIVEFKPQEPEVEPEAAELQAAAEAGSERDLVEVLRLSLEEEARNREALSSELSERESQLEQTRETLEERSRSLEQTREEKARLEAERAALAAEQARLSEAYTSASSRLDEALVEQEATASRLRDQQARAKALQEALASREAALEDANLSIEELSRQREEIERQRALLETDLKIVATEKAMIEQNLIAARTEVETVRLEKERAENRASQLAEGVTRLAESSSELKEEFRQSQPRSINDIFSEYQSNRISVHFTYTTAGIFGPRERTMTAHTILVEHAGQAYALFEASNTPFDLWSLGDLRSVKATVKLGVNTLEFAEVGFLRQDPRLVSVAVPGRLIEGSGVKVFRLEPELTRFSEAVLIANATGYYGESRFKLQPGRRDVIEMQTRLFNRLFGEFSPSRGDFVFSMGGNLLGLMVDDSNCALVLSPGATENLPIGERFDAGRAANLGARYAPRTPTSVRSGN